MPAKRRFAVAFATLFVICSSSPAEELDNRLFNILTGRNQRVIELAINKLKANADEAQSKAMTLARALPHLVEQVEGPKPRAIPDSTLVAVELLGPSDEPEVIDALVSLLDSSRLEIAMASAEALGRNRRAQALAALKRQVERSEFSNHYGFSYRILKSIAEIGDVDSIKFLSDLFPELKGQLKLEVGTFLAQVKLSDFDGDEDEWQKWKSETGTLVESFASPDDREPVFQIVASDKSEVPQYYRIPIYARRVVFVLDHSKSMRDVTFNESRMLRAKRELIRVLEQLPAWNYFNVVIFETRVKVWQRTLVQADEKNKKKAIRFITELRTGQMTNTFGALERSLDVDENTEAIYFLSDGKPTHGRIVPMPEIISEITKANRFRHISINTIGVAVKGATEEFMRTLAEKNGGVYRQAN